MDDDGAEDVGSLASAGGGDGAAEDRGTAAGGGVGDLRVLEESPFNAEVSLRQLVEPRPGGAFYVRNHFEVPDLDPRSWRVAVDGAVEEETSLGLEQLEALPRRSLAVTLECAGNGRTGMDPVPSGTPWNLGAVSTARFTGTPLRALLERVGLEPGAREVLFVGADAGEVAGGRTEAFARSLPRDEALEGDALLAWEMNGRPLPPDHGRPLRLVVPGWYGMASVKWLTRIRALTEPFEGWYQTERYVYRGEGGTPDGTPVTRMRVRALVATPRDGAEVEGPDVPVRGAAWSGHGDVVGVEVSDDGGESWEPAELGEPVSRHAAVPWRYRWRPETGGRHTLMARAADAAGHSQPLEPRWNENGYGNNAVQRVNVRVV